MEISDSFPDMLRPRGNESKKHNGAIILWDSLVTHSYGLHSTVALQIFGLFIRSCDSTASLKWASFVLENKARPSLLIMHALSPVTSLGQHNMCLEPEDDSKVD